jgi:hypothetical protein
MSVDIVGNLPQGKLLVTDAMVTSKEKVTSYRNCKLKDKIAKGWATHGYYSLVGDETILFGINAVDIWCSQNGHPFDFTDPSCMKRALDVAEKFIKVYKRTPTNENDTLYRGKTYVYAISKEKVVDYCILRQQDKYYISRCDEIFENQILINYGGIIEPVNIEIFQNAEPKDCINIAVNYVKQYHTNSLNSGKDFIITSASGGERWDLIDSPPF